MSSDQSNIHYLPHFSIDKKKWDQCISAAENGLIYGYSFYLDHMAKQWDALVMNDYEAVMPLPWRKKFGIPYLYHPALTAQLGVFGKNLSGDMVNTFLHAVPDKFRYWDFPLNQKNFFTPDYDVRERTNYVLPLNKSWEDLIKNFRDNLRREVKKSVAHGCVPKNNIPEQQLFEFLKFYSNEISRNDLRHFQHLYRQLKEKGMAKNIAIFSPENKLLSAAVFLFSHGRAYYIIAANHPDSRKLFTSHLLLHYFIQEHAGQGLLLDFEGSDIAGIASFFKSFGAVPEKYPAIKLNRLPWWARLFKK